MSYRTFTDRTQAAIELAKKIKLYLEDIGIDVSARSTESFIVLAIPRGGVVTGDVVASELDCGMDIIVSRKLPAEHNPELAIGAILPDGTYFVNENIAKMLNTSEEYIQNQVKRQSIEIERRLIEFRGNNEYGNKLNNKIAILVDDGIATGSTIIATARWIRQKQSCRMLIVAVPVAPATDDTLNKLRQSADMVIVLQTPREFQAVGQFYEQFDQVEDDEVKEIMKKYI